MRLSPRSRLRQRNLRAQVLSGWAVAAAGLEPAAIARLEAMAPNSVIEL